MHLKVKSRGEWTRSLMFFSQIAAKRRKFFSSEKNTLYSKCVSLVWHCRYLPVQTTVGYQVVEQPGSEIVHFWEIVGFREIVRPLRVVYRALSFRKRSQTFPEAFTCMESSLPHRNESIHPQTDKNLTISIVIPQMWPYRGQYWKSVEFQDFTP